MDEVEPTGVAPPEHAAAPLGSGPRNAGWRWLAVTVAALVVLVGGLVAWVESEAGPAAHPGAQVVVDVRPGDSLASVASQLASHGVISDALAYRIWLQFHTAPVVRPGSYALDRGAGFGTATAVLAGGPNVFDLQLPAGFTVAEVAQRVGQLPGYDGPTFESVATDGSVRSPFQPAGSTNLDGLLGTGTYRILPPATHVDQVTLDRRLLTRMVDRFDATAASDGLVAGSSALGRSPYEVVTVASIVQKEGVYQKNLGPVSRVIYNRLARGMPLQMDSTVLYALHRDGGTVTQADLATPTPYNTYLNTGLTPTPIGLVSPQALQAALQPPPGDWLYFVVVQPDGTEAFSATYAGQLANEALARQRGLG
ncbi:MAG: endolytic transglycosylase MltG [Actinomycetota bacterium]|nr:endolytic transglycosylase MltG [Actinomycetota bacterium]